MINPSSQIKPEMQAFFQLIAQGKVNEASAYVEADFNEVEAMRMAYMARSANNSFMRQVLETAVVRDETNEAQVPDAPTDVRTRVIELAAGIARQNSNVATLEAVVVAADAAGLELSSRPATSVANILFKAPNWRRVSPGVFQMI